MVLGYDGTSSANTLRGELSGSIASQTVTLSTPSAFLKFTSDNAIQLTGFTVSWRRMTFWFLILNILFTFK